MWAPVSATHPRSCSPMVVMSAGGVSGREESILSWYFGVIDFTNLTRMNLLVGRGLVGSDMSRITEKITWLRLYLRGVVRSICADLRR